MPKPPLRKGLDPLIQVGAVKVPLSLESDSFLQFLMFCEMTFRENLMLKGQLKKCGVDPEKFLARQAFPPGSPGRHRTIFDGWYTQIAGDLKARISKPEGKKSA
jgi:hypothetical protein